MPTILDTITKTLSQRPIITTTLATVGTLYLATKIWNLASFTNTHFLRRSSLNRFLRNPKGKPSTSWALVTGASDGIGKGFAEELLHLGFNVILHGRNEVKLERVREELLAQWPEREIEIFVFEAAGNIDDLEDALHQLSDLNIRVLINNVGAGARPFWLPFINQAENVRKMIRVDGLFTTEITRCLLPKLVERQPSLVLNIGSLTSDAPCPYVSVLSGAKAYNKAWSRSLDLEMKLEGYDIDVMHVLVGMVATANEGRTPSFMVPSPRRMAASTLDTVGCGRDVVIGYWPHALQYLAMTGLPSWISEKMILSIAKEEKIKEEAMLANT